MISNGIISDDNTLLIMNITNYMEVKYFSENNKNLEETSKCNKEPTFVSFLDCSGDINEN